MQATSPARLEPNAMKSKSFILVGSDTVEFSVGNAGQVVLRQLHGVQEEQVILLSPSVVSGFIRCLVAVAEEARQLHPLPSPDSSFLPYGVRASNQ
jgi:hypothetical protein